MHQCVVPNKLLNALFKLGILACLDKPQSPFLCNRLKIQNIVSTVAVTCLMITLEKKYPLNLELKEFDLPLHNVFVDIGDFVAFR